ncbi:MAG: hypothetical protein JWL69_2276 [Phycisphaerales bacterium]|nr:hypothetical protein [Phycisphaerales bacterium]
MNRDRLFLAAGAAVVIGVAIVVAGRWRPANNANFPNGTWWICQNPACKAEFSMSSKELGEWHAKHYGDPLPCPKCGQTNVIRAEKCEKCGRVYPAQGAVACPNCGHKPE